MERRSLRQMIGVIFILFDLRQKKFVFQCFCIIKLMIIRSIKINLRQSSIPFNPLLFSWNYKLSKMNKYPHTQPSASGKTIISNEVKDSLNKQQINMSDNFYDQNEKEQSSRSNRYILKVNKETVQDIINTIVKDLRQMQKKQFFLKGSALKIQNITASFQEILEQNSNILKKSDKNNVAFHAASFYFDYLLVYMTNKEYQTMNQKKRLLFAYQCMIKIKCCQRIFQNYKEKIDITNTQSERYQAIWQKCTFQKAKRKYRLSFEYLFTKKMLHVATAANVLKQNYQNFLIKNIVFVCALPWYFIAHNKSKLLSLSFYQNPNLLMTQNLCNIPEHKLLKKLSNIFFQSIKTNIELYIPINGNYDDDINIFQKNDNSIVVRLLHSHKIKKHYPKKIQENNEQQKCFEKVIVHIHGGGFIALSSSSSQNFTRRWANALEVPVFSIDYRMPPQHPFPVAPLDCYNSYRFIVHHIHKYLNIRPKQIIIAGDSAGGNLACSLTALILKNKQFTPKGIYLIYPALDLRMIFTSSRMHTFTDPLLQPSMLLLCLDAYLGDIDKSNDPLASPILLTQQYINGSKDERFPLQWPKTIITVGNKDPMYDDTLSLMQKMLESNISCQCIIYQQLTHGYLNMALFIKECQKTVDHSVAHLKKLMNRKNQRKLE